MSAINSPSQDTEFELLQPEPPAGHSDEIFVSLDDWTKLPEEESALQLDMTVGIVVDGETFIVLDRKPEDKEFTQAEWRQLIQSKQREIAEMKQEGTGVGKGRLSLRERSAVLSLQGCDSAARQRLWEIANYNEGVEQQFRMKQEQAQENKQEILTILSYQLAEDQLRSLKQNVLKLHKVVRGIGEQRNSSVDALRVWQNEKEIMQWVYDSLMRYAIQDQQVRYSKGLEYVCLGIVVAFPKVDLAKYSQVLHHFLVRHAFRDLYQEGSPRFFRELQKMRQALRQDAPELYTRIQESQGDFRNLFVSYFRSCLLYKVTNPEIIRRVFQLLFVEGVPAMRTLLLRMLTLHAQTLMQKEPFLEHICSQIVISYFQGSSSEQDIHSRFSQLFLM